MANMTLFAISLADTIRRSHRTNTHNIWSSPYCTLVVGPYSTAWTRESNAPIRVLRRPREPSRPPPSGRSYHYPTSTHSTLDDDTSVFFAIRDLRSKDATYQFWCIAVRARLQRMRWSAQSLVGPQCAERDWICSCRSRRNSCCLYVPPVSDRQAGTLLMAYLCALNRPK
jgi:hypothetical protein